MAAHRVAGGNHFNTAPVNALLVPDAGSGLRTWGIADISQRASSRYVAEASSTARTARNNLSGSSGFGIVSIALSLRKEAGKASDP